MPVLEIGPGLGALTSELINHASKVIAIEIDGRMVELLSKNLAATNLNIIHADFMKYPLSELAHTFGDEQCIVVGNLPYYITSPICQRLMDSSLNVSRMVLMMQSEAADRFMAKPGDKNYVPISVIAQQLYNISIGLKLSPASYFPSPEVNSTVLLFERSSRSFPANFVRIVKAAFAMRRKTIYNNLLSLSDKHTTSKLLEKANISHEIRAEALSPEEFFALAIEYDEIIAK